MLTYLFIHGEQNLTKLWLACLVVLKETDSNQGVIVWGDGRENPVELWLACLRVCEQTFWDFLCRESKILQKFNYNYQALDLEKRLQ